MAQAPEKIQLRFVNGNGQPESSSPCTYGTFKSYSTVRDIKQSVEHCFTTGKNIDKIQLVFNGKCLQNGKTLAYCNIKNNDLLIVSYNDWTSLYSQCPVCNTGSKGYWRHPGGNKCEFVSSKPSSGYIVEIKGEIRNQMNFYQIRCDGCKSACNPKDWQWKCPNHDYKKMSMFNKNYNNWTTLYGHCPACNSGSKGYWKHPGGSKCEFVISKPSSGYTVEIKGEINSHKIRCDGSGCKKNEVNPKNWQWKCPNHDYKNI